ncbi:hypothetical protein [Gordonia sp. (in: high G+C Gram-positive bacteria)]|uniref:hypothetical protein n=1 Tax=Gordonia sp. (in: high G+C Gram-positive bacteria) TaxID=84139 RepID=UPI00333E21FA
MDLKHYPRRVSLDQHGAFTLDRTREYDQTLRYDKPDGLWVSVAGPDDWRHWTQAEEFRSDETSLSNEHDVVLADRANLLHLDSADAVRGLTADFGMDPRDAFSSSVHRIDWPLIATQWDGIVITPYQWSCRNDWLTFWYYGWDCASGCIWNLDAIDSVTPAPLPALTAGPR